jgi:hypothetical protein
MILVCGILPRVLADPLLKSRSLSPFAIRHCALFQKYLSLGMHLAF